MENMKVQVRLNKTEERSNKKYTFQTKIVQIQTGFKNTFIFQSFVGHSMFVICLVFYGTGSVSALLGRSLTSI